MSKQEYDRARYTPEIGRKKNLAALYGITLEEYNVKLVAQNGMCAVCGGPETTKNHNLAVDHDHTTGAIRGLLCHHCNIALGHLKDDPARVQALLRYIQSYA